MAHKSDKLAGIGAQVVVSQTILVAPVIPVAMVLELLEPVSPHKNILGNSLPLLGQTVIVPSGFLLSA